MTSSACMGADPLPCQGVAPVRERFATYCGAGPGAPCQGTLALLAGSRTLLSGSSAASAALSVSATSGRILPLPPRYQGRALGMTPSIAVVLTAFSLARAD